jgi:hypothetical protein
MGEGGARRMGGERAGWRGVGGRQGPPSGAFFRQGGRGGGRAACGLRNRLWLIVVLSRVTTEGKRGEGWRH